MRLGEDARKAGFKVGDRVAAAGCFGVCGTCEDCTHTDTSTSGELTLKYDQHCQNQSGFVGVWSLPGAFQEYTSVDYRFTARLPASFAFEDAAPLTCAGLTAWRSLLVARLQAKLAAGDWIAVLGSGGGLGHLVVQYAKRVGLKVIGVEARDQGVELSKKAGCDVVLDLREFAHFKDDTTKNEAIAKAVSQAITGSSSPLAGVQASIILTDHTSAPSLACALTARHGVSVLVGLPSSVHIPYEELVFRDIRLVGSNIGSSADVQELFEVFAQKDEKSGKGMFVERKVFDGLESLESVIETYMAGGVAGKLVVRVDPSLC